LEGVQHIYGPIGGSDPCEAATPAALHDACAFVELRGCRRGQEDDVITSPCTRLLYQRRNQRSRRSDRSTVLTPSWAAPYRTEKVVQTKGT